MRRGCLVGSLTLELSGWGEACKSAVRSVVVVEVLEGVEEWVDGGDGGVDVNRRGIRTPLPG
jgi:hypothetical protein